MTTQTCVECGRPSALFQYTDGYRCLSCSLATEYDLLCAFCGVSKSSHTTSIGDSVCEKCYREFEISLQFADEPELEAYFAGTASEGFTRRVERWWKWHEED